VILNRRESAMVIAWLRLLAVDGVRVPDYPYVLVPGLCDETDQEYELRFDADGEYIRKLIDRIDEMSLRGVKLCNRDRKSSGEMGRDIRQVQSAACDRNVGRHFVLQKGAAVSWRTSRGIG
jgi:hypothetical protein